MPAPYRVLSPAYRYDPKSTVPFRLSRTKLDLFLDCPRCFYLDRRLGVRQLDTFETGLNNAVDALMKREFDLHRAAGTKHPACAAEGIDAVPYQSPHIDAWRDAMKRGITHDVPGTNLCITGGLDDVWLMPTGELLVVDYKATATVQPPSLDGPYSERDKRQVEIYQWLLHQNGHKVDSRAYFVFVNADAAAARFDETLHFTTRILAYAGDDSWVDTAVQRAYECLQGSLPASSPGCNHCAYREAANSALS